MNKSNRVIEFFRNNKILIVIFLIGIIVRVYAFGGIPSGLHQDEAQTGYDAYSILSFGVDRNGFHNPVHFVGFGSGYASLYAYLSIPFIKIFDLNIYSVRIINLVFGLISLFAFYFLIREISDKKIATLSAFLLAINPWHIMISRWAFDANLFPAFFLIANFFLVLSLKKEKCLPVSFSFFALSLYTYLAAYFVVPFFLVISSIYLIIHRKVRSKIFIISWTIFLIIGLPIFLFIVINSFKLSPIESNMFSIPRLTVSRFETQSAVFSSDFIEKVIHNFKTFIHLLITQNDGWLQNGIPSYGFLYLFSIPLALFGLYLIIRQSCKLKIFNKSFFIFIWFLSGLILSVLVPSHIHKLNIIFLPLIFLTSKGMNALKSDLCFALVLVYLLSFASFTNAYFNTFPEQIGQRFFESFDEAIIYATENTDGPICITGQVNMPYIYVLFYRKIDSRIFKDTVIYRNPGAEFQQVSSFDRYYFYFEDCGKREDVEAFVFHNSESGVFNQEKYVITKFRNYSVAIKRTGN